MTPEVAIERSGGLAHDYYDAVWKECVDARAEF